MENMKTLTAHGKKEFVKMMREKKILAILFNNENQEMFVIIAKIYHKKDECFFKVIRMKKGFNEDVEKYMFINEDNLQDFIEEKIDEDFCMHEGDSFFAWLKENH